MAAGVSSVSPFFKEDRQLGTDIQLPEARPSGGVQASNSAGLYGGAPDGSAGSGSPAPAPSTAPGTGTGPGTGVWGGSTKPGTCAVAKLKKFLTDPKNSAKAQEWARVLHISTDQIPSYIDQLTPVVLRHDTLVTNHDYKNGKAVSYAALLQAGIAILVDQQGLPAVKCSCGNPLLPFEGKASKTDVRFKDGNKKWADYRQDRVVVVEPPPGAQEIHKLQLVDVHNPDRGIARPVGSDGSQDQSFNTRQKHAVPPVTGMTFAEATRRLTDAGLGMSYAGDTLAGRRRPGDGVPADRGQPGRLGHVGRPVGAVRQPVRERRWPGHAIGFRHEHGRHERHDRNERNGLGSRDDPADTVRGIVRPLLRPLLRPLVRPLVRRRVVRQRLAVRQRHRVGCPYGHRHLHPHENRHAHRHPHGHERRHGRRHDVDPVARLSDEQCPYHPLGHCPDRADDRADLARTDLDQTHRQQRAADE
ncbi:DUF6777 domain-containing protein [Streptomyces sp. S1D4-11]